MGKNNIEFELLDAFDPNDIGYMQRYKWIETILEFERSEAKAIKLVCKNQREKQCCTGAIRSYIRKHNHDWTVYPEPRSYNVYVVRS